MSKPWRAGLKVLTSGKITLSKRKTGVWQPGAEYPSDPTEGSAILGGVEKFAHQENE